MSNPKYANVATRARMCVAVLLLILIGVHTPVPAQHEGHDMSSMPKPAPKAKKRAPRRATTRAKPRAPRRRIAPAPTPAPPAASQPHTEQHQGHTMPSQQPTPAPTQQPSPTQQPAPATPAIDHSMHGATQTQAQPQPRQRARRDLLPEGPAVRLEDLEKMAAERNPTLAQADASVRASEGRRRQAGLFPNPVVGYFGEELTFRAPSQTSEHGVFVEQTIPLGGKLGKSKRIFEREREQAQAIAEAQRQRVLNSVRVLYFDALAAQRLVELRADLADLAREAVEITKELYNVGQADFPDQLEIEIEAERAEIELLRARTDWEQVWRALGAMVNNPELRPARLAGNLEEGLPALEEGQMLATILRDSPEIRAAQAGVERARAVLARAKAERIPDLFVRGGVGYNNELLESDGRKKGAVGRVELGVNVPIFNRNQGGIAASEAELAIAEREVERLQLALRTRLASSFREYRNAQQMSERYRTQVVPRARRAYEMYLSNFRQMAASYPQVLIAQRTLFQVEVEYARALLDLRRGAVSLRGFLLTDGLGKPGEAGEATEGFMLRSASDATGDSDNR